MAESKLPNNENSSDEIDLGQLFNMVQVGLRNIFTVFIKGYIYLRKNSFILAGLILVGFAAGYMLNRNVTKKLKTEVIVKPNLESKTYLYDVIQELNANIKSQDTAFFNILKIDVEDLKGFKIEIESVSNKEGNSIDFEYLELLEKFQQGGMVSDVVRAEILNKSSLNHHISFYYLDAIMGQKITRKLIDYINSNTYFKELINIYADNANKRIQNNLVLIEQIDELISNYSVNLAQKENPLNDGRIVLNNEEQIDIKGLFELKNNLIQDTERKRVELIKNKNFISIINFGKPQQVQKAFFNKSIILIPLVLIGLFFLISIIRYLNGRASEMHLE